MANTLITPSIIAKEALFHLENNVIMGDKVHRQYRNEFVKIGDSLTIRRPVKFLAKDGATRVNQDVIENTTSIVINQRKHVSWNFSSQDLTLTVDEYAERYIKPAMIVLANTIDVSLADEGANEFYNVVGTIGETFNDYTTISNAGQRMDELSVPDDGNRCMVVHPASRWGLATQLGSRGSSGIDNPQIVSEMRRMARLGMLGNFDIYGTQNIQRHLAGVQGGTPLVNGTVTNGTSTVTLDGATASIANWARKGDIVTFAGVNSVNDISKVDNGVLAEFVVTADTASVGGGAVTLPIFPALNNGSTASTAAFQNVSALPADNAAVTFKTGGTSASTFQDLAFHRNALALVTVPLELPDSATFKARANWRGYSIRVIKDYDIDSDNEIIRLDILYGVKAIYPDLGVRIQGGDASGP